MLKIAVTGRIASGKSLVVEYIKKSSQKGAIKSICCDSYVHQLYREDETLIEWIWSNILDKKQKKQTIEEQERRLISEIIFKDKIRYHNLQQQVIPRVKKHIIEEVNSSDNIIVEVPLLFELGWEIFFNYSIWVFTPIEVRQERWLKRGKNKESFIQRNQRQSLYQVDIDSVDMIINNSDDKDNTRRQCELLWSRISTD